ncbi:MAG: GHKL domain-containing protein [Desulfarculus sp.]|nr:GHKL domain-containing protein [Pseudomonadota bacterium]MBU4599950.1 GHKL domain-containing protein [Pseudomonadota bacterium]MBV1714614.1 GHKL domain-containing protein [Desulfarculus sp.]MBV1740151.1 GHKL domain-containing protein [Desulfarculus sp.]
MNRYLKITAYVGFALISLCGLYYLSRVNYLLFHSMVEGYSTVIAFAIFIQTWNTRPHLENGYLLYLGVAYLFIGLLDFLHFLAYTGMRVFSAEGPNLPTQLWVAARYMESFSLLTAFLFIKRHLKGYWTLVFFAALTTTILAGIFPWKFFPDSYQTDVGLTTFKIFSEYAICLMLIFALILIYRYRRNLDPHVRRLMVWSVVLTILAELTFTQYVSLYGFINMLGHLFKIASFYLIYKAIVFTGFTRPMDLYFKEIKEKDAMLQKDLITIEEMAKEQEMALSLLAHDMKNPLISIKGFSNLILTRLERLSKDKTAEYAKVIYRQSQRLEALIQNFLISSRRGEHKLSLDLKRYDIATFFKEVAEGFSEFCKESGIALETEAPSGSLDIYLDTTHFYRAISNLLDNAIRFSPRETTIRLMASLIDGEVIITVQDQGPGIPETEIDKLFRPFYRGEGQKGDNGYGLGLAGVKTIVESHGGSISASNVESGGALFTIRLPKSEFAPRSCNRPI